MWRMRRRLAVLLTAGMVVVGMAITSRSRVSTVSGAPSSGRGPIGGHPMFTVLSWGHPAAARVTAASVPTWTGSFTYSAKTYNFTMVGTNPAAGSVTTTVPTEILPLKVVASNGISTSGTPSS